MNRLEREFPELREVYIPWYWRVMAAAEQGIVLAAIAVSVFALTLAWFHPDILRIIFGGAK